MKTAPSTAPTTDAEIARIGRGLLDRSLPATEWTHAAHFAAALWLLRHHPGFDGPRDMPSLIRAYNVATGGENTDSAGYHETITLASLRAARSSLDSFPPTTPLCEVLCRLLVGPQGRSDWLLAYWSHGLLFTTLARREWLEPDLQALPF
jgi:hypothetical protein